MEVAKNMDSVFAGAMEDDFDVIFDVEDSLIDAVNGYNEAGDPLTGADFEDLHQTQDDATVKDVKDYDAGDEPMGVKDAEGTKPAEELDTSVKGEENKESDGDKFIKNSEENYQEDKEKDPNVVDNDVNKNIENVIEAKDLDAFMMDDDEDDDIVAEKCCKESDDKKEKEVVEESKGGRTSKQMAADMADSDKEPVAEADILAKADFEDLHQTQDDATVKDVENYDAPDSPMGVKDAEGTDKEKLEDAPAEGKVKDAEMFTDKTDVKIEEEVNITVDDLESEIKKESEKAVKDLAEAAVDPEVEKVDDEDLDDEDNLIDAAAGKKTSSKPSSEKYAYDISDEDLIDMAMNN